MKHTHTLTIITAALCASAISSQAALIAEYDFNHSPTATVTVLSGSLASSSLFAATDNDANVTASNISVGSGLTGLTYVSNTEDYFQIAEGNGMSDGVHADGGDITTDMNAAYAAGDYIEFLVTAGAGFTLDLTTLTFDFARAERGTNDYAVLTSVDGFSAYAALVDQAAPEGLPSVAGAAQSVDLSAAAYQGLSDITFRVIFDDRQNDTGGASASVIDNIIVNGTVVPEPSSTALLGLGGLALILRRRK
ncbi:MAG: PEP-CTERM sorting domain-containing protein [Akkermansiaceae bacterium]